MSAVPRDCICALTDRLDSDSSGTSKWNVGCYIHALTVTKSRQSLTVMPCTACAGSRADRVVVRRTMELTGSGVLACMNELLNGRVGVQRSAVYMIVSCRAMSCRRWYRSTDVPTAVVLNWRASGTKLVPTKYDRGLTYSHVDLVNAAAVVSSCT